MLNAAYYFLANWAVFAVALAVVVVFWMVLFPRASNRYRLPDDPNIIDLQLAFKKPRFVEILDTWMEHKGARAIGQLRASILQLDFIFPVAYGVMFASAIARLTVARPEPPGRLALGLCLLPLAAAACDYVENLIHLVLLRNVQAPDDLRQLPAAPIWIASALASVKILLLVDAVQVVVVLLIF